MRAPRSSATRSAAAAILLRSLMARTGLDPARISVSRCRSVDWQSLTFVGELHEISLAMAGPDPAAAMALLRDGLADAEWQLNGHVVADIVITGETRAGDGSILVDLEALTLSD